MSTRSAEYYWTATWAGVVVAIYAAGLRLYLAWDLPLWIDESWTAVLSSAPTFQSFAWQMWLDSNAPLYYLLIWIWPFESNLGLRAPSFIFMLAAATVAALWRPAGLHRQVAWFWAFLLLLWQPGIILFLDARYYGLLFLISTAQTIAYIKLLDEPDQRRAILWAGLATLGVLTHYFAAIPATVQGLYYLWRHRGGALRTWPAALVTLPALAWGFYHLPRLQLYAQPGSSWYQLLSPSKVPEQLAWLVGGETIGIGLLVLVAVFWKREGFSPSIVAAVLTAGASAALLVAAGLLWPLFTFRYLIPLAPPILLGVATSVKPAGYLPIALCFVLNLGSVSRLADQLRGRASFGLEQQARYLKGARSVTWMIDYRGAKMHDRAQMEAMLVDAFARTGQRVRGRWGHDLLNGDGLIWFYRTERSRAVNTIKRKWRCKDIRRPEINALVCKRPEPSLDSAPGKRATPARQAELEQRH